MHTSEGRHGHCQWGPSIFSFMHAILDSPLVVPCIQTPPCLPDSGPLA